MNRRQRGCSRGPLLVCTAGEFRHPSNTELVPASTRSGAWPGAGQHTCHTHRCRCHAARLMPRHTHIQVPSTILAVLVVREPPPHTHSNTHILQGKAPSKRGGFTEFSAADPPDEPVRFWVRVSRVRLDPNPSTLTHPTNSNPHPNQSSQQQTRLKLQAQPVHRWEGAAAAP